MPFYYPYPDLTTYGVNMVVPNPAGTAIYEPLAGNDKIGLNFEPKEGSANLSVSGWVALGATDSVVPESVPDNTTALCINGDIALNGGFVTDLYIGGVLNPANAPKKLVVSGATEMNGVASVLGNLSVGAATIPSKVTIFGDQTDLSKLALDVAGATNITGPTTTADLKSTSAEIAGKNPVTLAVDAAAKAAEAKDTADKAQNDANTAVAAASDAKTIAETAQGMANAAKTVADAAKVGSDAAVQSATKAVEIAAGAVTIAISAVDIALKVEDNVKEQVKAAADSAKAAEEAKVAAENAAAEAADARKSAVDAAAAASTSAANAETFKTAAEIASQKADKAKTAAKNSEDAANRAKEDAERAYEGAQDSAQRAANAAQRAEDAANLVLVAAGGLQPGVLGAVSDWVPVLALSLEVLDLSEEVSRLAQEAMRIADRIMAQTNTSFFAGIMDRYGKPDLVLKNGFFAQKEYGSFKRGKFIVLGTKSLPRGERKPPYAVRPRPAATRYGMSIEWESDFALLQLVDYRRPTSGGGVTPGIRRRDTVLSWGNDPRNRFRLRFAGPYQPGKLDKVKSCHSRDVVTVLPNGNMFVRHAVYALRFDRSSDLELKTAVEPLEGALDKVMQMRGVTFDWRADAEAESAPPGAKQMGVIAQEVEGLFPGLVTTDENGYKAVDYDQLTPLLLEAVKEQQGKLASQEDRIQRLEDALRKLGAVN